MKCEDCIFCKKVDNNLFSYYKCPFTMKDCDGLDDCHCYKMYFGMIKAFREKLNLYKHIQTALLEELNK